MFEVDARLRFTLRQVGWKVDSRNTESSFPNSVGEQCQSTHNRTLEKCDLMDGYFDRKIKELKQTESADGNRRKKKD